MPRPERAPVRDVLAAGTVAGLVSGSPSTLHALAIGADPLEPARAAGSLLLPRERRTAPLLLAAAPVHFAISVFWAAVLVAILPPRRRAAVAALAGLGIAALDLKLVGRRFPRMRALPQLPQLADHVTYALAVAGVLGYRQRRREAER